MSVIPSGTHLHDEPPAALDAGTAVDHARLAAIAIERTRMPMCITDPQAPDNPIVLANRAFLKQTGYSADEVIGRNCRFLQGPGTDPADVARIRDAVARQDHIVVELLNYKRDGTPFWNRLLVSPITDDDDNVLYYFASQEDVTETRRAAELASREHDLLREVDHRAKNALALVQGIVRMTRSDDAGNYSRSVQGRVDALAQAHVLLSDAKWRDVPMRTIVAAATAPFGADRTPHDGPAVTVPAAHVQPLMLTFHELLTNAAQHGGLSASSGRAELSWRTEGDQIVVEVVETGGPPAEAAGPSGYGLTLVDAFVRRQLRGTVERRWQQPGLTTRLAFLRDERARATR